MARPFFLSWLADRAKTPASQEGGPAKRFRANNGVLAPRRKNRARGLALPAISHASGAMGGRPRHIRVSTPAAIRRHAPAGDHHGLLRPSGCVGGPIDDCTSAVLMRIFHHSHVRFGGRLPKPRARRPHQRRSDHCRSWPWRSAGPASSQRVQPTEARSRRPAARPLDEGVFSRSHPHDRIVPAGEKPARRNAVHWPPKTARRRAAETFGPASSQVGNPPSF